MMKNWEIARELKKGNLKIAEAGLSSFFSVRYGEGAVVIESDPERLSQASDDELINIMELATELKQEFDRQNVACIL